MVGDFDAWREEPIATGRIVRDGEIEDLELLAFVEGEERDGWMADDRRRGRLRPAAG